MSRLVTMMVVCLLLHCPLVVAVSSLLLLVVSGVLELPRVIVGVLFALVVRRTFLHCLVGSGMDQVARLLWHR